MLTGHCKSFTSRPIVSASRSPGTNTRLRPEMLPSAVAPRRTAFRELRVAAGTHRSGHSERSLLPALPPAPLCTLSNCSVRSNSGRLGSPVLEIHPYRAGLDVPCRARGVFRAIAISRLHVRRDRNLDRRSNAPAHRHHFPARDMLPDPRWLWLSRRSRFAQTHARWPHPRHWAARECAYLDA